MNLKARIKTKNGLTREITIKDSIRQGGVLSVIQYASVMDETAKEIEKLGIGVTLPGTGKTIGCLLWMDDVLLLADNEKDLQALLDCTHKTASKYHIVFGEEKSKVMVIGKRDKQTQCKLGIMKLQTTPKYKYLGEIITDSRSITPTRRSKKKN